MSAVQRGRTQKMSREDAESVSWIGEKFQRNNRKFFYVNGDNFVRCSISKSASKSTFRIVSKRTTLRVQRFVTTAVRCFMVCSSKDSNAKVGLISRQLHKQQQQQSCAPKLP
jgi:hypothetical protein